MDHEYGPRWSALQICAALSLIPIGWLCSMAGLGLGFAGGGTWITSLGKFAYFAGPWLIGAGVLWLVLQITLGPFPLRSFSLRSLLVLVTLIAVALAAAAVM
jgi:hypothetical protein